MYLSCTPMAIIPANPTEASYMCNLEGVYTNHDKEDNEVGVLQPWRAYKTFDRGDVNEE